MAFNLNWPKPSSGAAGNAGEQTITTPQIRPAPRGARKPAGFGAGLFARHSIARQLQILGGVLLILLLTIGILVYRDNRTSAENAARIATASELRMLSQRLAKASTLALRGDSEASAMLRDSHHRFTSGLESLRNGGELGGVAFPPSPPSAAPLFDEFAAKWDGTHRKVTQLLEAEAKIRIFGKYLAAFDGDAPKATEAPGGLDVETRRIVAELDAASSAYGATIDAVLGGMRDVASARQAGAALLADNEDLLDAADALIDAYRSESGGQGIHEVSLLALIVLVLAVLAMMARIYVTEAHRQAERAEKSRQESERNRQESERSRQESDRVNHQNQDAILRLMNELGDLADGDLTVTATVSEDITGAIADSINYTVEELRVLVGRINDAASRVTAATEIAQHTSAELLEAAQRQSREIQEAGHLVLDVARSMNHVSGDADQSARVARQSLAAAGKGTLAVQNSIKGMDEIRRRIQETSKRIKRLGESSQEIGEIVELISDITEQTNVLALNAAIQAASAGDAGRGFTVVAEEVQRLAERSGGATKQIAAIVKAIQSDTQGAISAMEESTRGVVEEAKLSDAAGQALSEIGAVSQNLAELIERISEATRQQASAATSVAGKMQSILKVTEQTTAGTQKTAQAVGELAGLATELKGSVAGFKVE